MNELAKVASDYEALTKEAKSPINFQQARLGLTGTALALMASKEIHSGMVNREKPRDIKGNLADLENRKDRMQAVRTAVVDHLGNVDNKAVDNKLTEIKVGRSMLPWKDSYNFSVDLKDQKGESIGDVFGLSGDYDGKVYKEKDGDYTGYIANVFTRENMQGKGIGRLIENGMVKSFTDVGASKARLMPAFDGPMVWAKEHFGYSLSPKDKKLFLGAYKKYTTKQGLPFEDLGDKPSDYPGEFLKVMTEHGPLLKSVYYEKPLAKVAWTKKLHEKEIDKAFDRMEELSSRYHMNPGEAEGFLQQMKERKGLDLSLGVGEDEESAFFAPKMIVSLAHKLKNRFPEFAQELSDETQMIKNVLSADPTKDGYIEAGNNKLIFLHELGHAVDYKERPFAANAENVSLMAMQPVASLVGGLGATITPIVMAKDEEKKTNGHLIAGSLGGALTGLGMTVLSDRITAKHEDKANNLVKEYLTETLGDPQKAKEAFGDSHLAPMRETYRRGAQRRLLGTAKIGLGGAGIGLGIASLLNAHKDEEQPTELAKVAASFDAQRNKQYWQMLKRMYGGSDEAMQNLKVNPNSDFFHSTNPENIDSILEKGLEPSESGLGLGAYLGNLNTTKAYGDSRVRLKRPSELKGTKELYPNVNKVMSSNYPGNENPSIAQMNAIYYGKTHGSRKDPDFIVNAPRGQVQVTETINPNLLTRVEQVNARPKTMNTEPNQQLPLTETETTKGKSVLPYIGLGVAGAGATGGLAYLAHKKSKEKKQEGAN